MRGFSTLEQADVAPTGGGTSELTGPPPLGMVLHVGEGVRPPPPDDAACRGGGQTPPRDDAACQGGGSDPPPP